MKEKTGNEAIMAEYKKEAATIKKYIRGTQYFDKPKQQYYNCKVKGYRESHLIFEKVVKDIVFVIFYRDVTYGISIDYVDSLAISKKIGYWPNALFTRSGLGLEEFKEYFELAKEIFELNTHIVNNFNEKL